MLALLFILYSTLTHFINVHRTAYFPSPINLSGDSHGLCISTLTAFYERFQPELRFINVNLASLIGCETPKVKNFRKTIAYNNALEAARNSIYHSGASGSNSSDLCDVSLVDQVTSLERDISNLS